MAGACRAALPNKDSKGLPISASNGFAASMRSAPLGSSQGSQLSSKGPSPLGKANGQFNGSLQDSAPLGASPTLGQSGLASLARPPAYGQQKAASLLAGIESSLLVKTILYGVSGFGDHPACTGLSCLYIWGAFWCQFTHNVRLSLTRTNCAYY